MTPEAAMQAEPGRSGARHTEAAVSSPGKIVWRMVLRGRIHYVFMLLSNYGRMILTKKYDAFTTDHAYFGKPQGRLGPIGRAVDAYVLRFPLHEGLRQRLALVVREVVAGVDEQAKSGAKTVRVLSAPCGLARDITMAAGQLRARPVSPRVEWTGLDIDERGDVLPEAARRAEAAGVEVRFLREDLFAAETQLSRAVKKDGKFHVINCIGLTAWLDLPDVERLAHRFAELLAPGGRLVVDNFHEHSHSHLGKALEMPTRYHPDGPFQAAWAKAGFTDFQHHRTANGVNSVWTARLPSSRRRT